MRGENKADEDVSSEPCGPWTNGRERKLTKSPTVMKTVTLT